MERKNHQLELFDDSFTQDAVFQKAEPRIDVVKMNYDVAQSLSWKDLFSGFDTLFAITYSSGLNFINKLLDLFSHAEIIFGCESVMNYSLQEVMAFQGNLIERIRNNRSIQQEKLLSRIDQNEVKLFVARSQISHEKLYLLSASDGRKRVIMGSANMSYTAFAGHQRENVCYLDGDEAYNWYYDVFCSLKENSSDEISHKALTLADMEEHLDDLPISETVKTRKALVLEPVFDMNQEIEFILDTRRCANEMRPYAPKKEKKTGKISISPEHIIQMRRHIVEESVKKKEQRSEFPELIVNVFDSTVSLNGTPLDLNPAKEDIRRDVELFLKYMKGYENFHGDYLGMQYRYFEFANWFFCSPFMATMRDMAARYDQNRLPYPVFGLVYGQSKAGKTSFLETLLKMMIGQKPKVAAQDFTRSSIENLKRTVKGAPIIVDDMINTRFNQHAIETIKTDDFGVADHLVNYSAVVISANEDVKAVSPEVIRRTVICRVEAGLTNTEVMKSNVVRSVQREIGTAFYRAYLSRMLVELQPFIESMKDDDSESAPDILQLSSEIIVSIIKEYAEPPAYIRRLSLENYFSEQVTGKHAINSIRTAWKTSRKSFHVDKKNNELRYNAGAPYEVDRLMKELPETLEARKSRDWVVLNLSAAVDFFQIEFNATGVFSKFFRNN